jgi:hypothetical protein
MMYATLEGEARLPGWTGRGIGAVTIGVSTPSRSQ